MLCYNLNFLLLPVIFLQYALNDELLIGLQDEMHQLLLSFAEAGAIVLRLKGGDPLVRSLKGLSLLYLFFHKRAIAVDHGHYLNDLNLNVILDSSTLLILCDIISCPILSFRISIFNYGGIE